MKLRIVLMVVLFVVLLSAMSAWAGNQAPMQRSNDPQAVATAVAVQSVVKTGVTPTFNAASASTNSFANDGHTVLFIKNGWSDTLAVTLTVVGTLDGLAVTNRSITVATGAEAVLGPFTPAVYNTAGSATVSWSTVTTVTFAVLSW